jgi:Predicted transcriptional regulators
MPDRICYVSSKESFNYTLSIISGKWNLKIIYILACVGTIRYGELKKSIDGITHKMLSSQLKELELENIIVRNEYPQLPPKVEYSLTKRGESLIPLLREMCDWGEIHQKRLDKEI